MKKITKKFIIIIMLVTIATNVISTNFYASNANEITYTYKQNEPNLFLALLSDGVLFIGELIEDILSEALGTRLGEEADLDSVSPSIQSIVFNEYPITRLDYFRENVRINGYENEFANGINGTISQLYIALLVIVIAIYVFMLVYVGIKIIISSVAEEQAKFKRTLTSWVMGLVLLMCFHFVMGYAIEINDLGVNFARQVMEETIGSDELENGQTIIENLMQKFKNEAVNTNYKKLKNPEAINNIPGGDPAKYVNDSKYDDCFTSFNAINIVKAVVWLALTVKIVLIAIKYIKRLLMVTFLILIFPFVTISYVFDRVKDGKSHMFDIWFRTFLVNIFINFLHVIVYLIVVELSLKVMDTTSLGWLLPVIAILTFDKIAEQVGNLFGITKSSLSSPTEMSKVVTETGKGMIDSLKQKLSFSQNGSGNRISDEIKMINSMEGAYKGEKPQNQLIEKVIMTSTNTDLNRISETKNEDSVNQNTSYSKQMLDTEDNTIKNIGNNKITADISGNMKNSQIQGATVKEIKDKTEGTTTQKVDMSSVLSNISLNANVKAKTTVDVTDALMNMFSTSSEKGSVLDKPENTKRENELQEENMVDDEYSMDNVLKRAGIDVSMLTVEEKEEIYKMQMESYQELSKEAKIQMQKKEKIQKRRNKPMKGTKE